MCLDGYCRFKYGFILLIAWYHVLQLKNLCGKFFRKWKRQQFGTVESFLLEFRITNLGIFGILISC